MHTLATFRSDYEYEVEYEYDFGISKQTSFQSPRSSLLMTSREACFVNLIAVTGDNVKPAMKNLKGVLVLNLVLVVRSEGR